MSSDDAPDRVDRTDARRRSGQRHVDRFGKLRFELRVAEPVDRGGERGFQSVRRRALITLPAFGAFFGRQGADAAPDRGYLAAAAEKAYAKFFKRAFVGDAGQLRGEPLFQRR